jgi:hypothetical protein
MILIWAGIWEPGISQQAEKKQSSSRIILILVTRLGPAVPARLSVSRLSIPTLAFSSNMLRGLMLRDLDLLAGMQPWANSRTNFPEDTVLGIDAPCLASIMSSFRSHAYYAVAG